MRRTTIIFIATVLLTVSTNLLAISGYWEKRSPELNGEIPSPRSRAYSSPIGENKILLLKEAETNQDTWIYHYDLDWWQKIECEFYPKTDSYLDDQPIVNITKDIVMTYSYDYHSHSHREWSVCIFHLDSLKWYKLETKDFVVCDHLIQIAPNKIIGYRLPLDKHGVTIAQTWLLEIDLQEPIENTKIKSTMLLEETPYNNRYNAGPYDATRSISKYRFICLNSEIPVLYVAPRELNPVGKVLPFMYLDTTDWKWKEIKRNFIMPNGRGNVNLTNNIILKNITTRVPNPQQDKDFVPETLNSFHYYTYDNVEKIMKMEEIECLNKPPARHSFTFDKIKENTAMLFGGTDNTLYWNGHNHTYYNDTWIFHLTDTTDIINSDITKENCIFYVGRNNYLLTNIYEAELFDILGNFISKHYDNSVIDMNKYAVGVYIIRYVDNEKNIRSEKIIRE